MSTTQLDLAPPEEIYAQAELIHLSAAMIDTLHELRLACQKHGHWASFTDRPIIEWQVILGEEFGEFTKEVCDAHFGKPDWPHLYEEAAQTAAMSIATLAWLRSTGKVA
jgi:hypothetical protein